MGKLRIAFVDDDLDNFHANTFLKLARADHADRVEVAACWARRGERGRAWAQANGVAWVDDPAALASCCDAYCVLAPSDPSTHLELCRAALPAGKPTYVDKTFAPDLATAREIFALADRHRAPVQTTSVLRYTSAQKRAAENGPLRHVACVGGGASFAEYGIHVVELAVSLLGPDAIAVQRRGDERDVRLLVDFAGERSAVIDVFTAGEAPFAATITGKRTEHVALDRDPIFADGWSAIVAFLAAGEPSIDRRESLAIRAILDAAQSPAARTAPVRLPLERAAAG